MKLISAVGTVADIYMNTRDWNLWKFFKKKIIEQPRKYITLFNVAVIQPPDGDNTLTEHPLNIRLLIGFLTSVPSSRGEENLFP